MAGVRKKPVQSNRRARIRLLENEVLCELARPRSGNGAPKTEKHPEACQKCESPCEYGREWLRLLQEEEEASKAAAAEQQPERKKPGRKPGRKPKEPVGETVAETMTADLQEARIEELQKALEAKETELQQARAELKRAKDDLAAADGEAARAETATKNANKRVAVLLEEREKLAKEAEEARGLLEVVCAERDDAERERQAAERKRDELREIAETEHIKRVEAEETCIRLKAALWDMEHPSART